MGKIGGDGERVRRALGYKLGKISRAACQIQYDRTLRHGGQRDPLAFPAPVHSVGKDARDEIVFRSDDPEHVAHQSGICLFGRNGHFRAIVAQDAAPKLH